MSESLLIDKTASLKRTIGIAEPTTSNQEKLLKQGIWVYLILLILEGALRKWALPGLATPLLVIRDPVALFLIIVSWNSGYLKSNIYIIGIVATTLLSFFTALFFGHGNIFVALYGARIFLLHFPLIFIIGFVFTRDDVLKMGNVLLWMSIPMAVLIFMQFYSPQSAWVNRGIGGDMEGGGFSGSMGYFRPPATFSFISGTASFFTLVAGFVFFFWLTKDDMNKVLLIGATAAVLIAIPLSISRTLLFGVLITFIFALFAVARKPSYLGRMIAVLLLLSVALFVFKDNDALQTPLAAFTDRFDSANEQEGGLQGVVGDRFLGGMLGAISGSTNLLFWGYGIGMGSNVGAMLLSGKVVYLISEGEWGRLIGEQGFLVGLIVILLRLAFCMKISIAAYHKLLTGELLPWMLLSFCVLNIAQGQWSQPTSLGFSVLSGGLILAALRDNGNEEKEII